MKGHKIIENVYHIHFQQSYDLSQQYVPHNFTSGDHTSTLLINSKWSPLAALHLQQ